MKKNMKMILIILSIIIIGAIGAIVGSQLPPPELEQETGPGQPPPPRDRTLDPDEHRVYVTIKTGIAMANLAMCGILIVTYIQIYRNVRSKFTLGLIALMFSLTLYVITSNPIIQSIFGYKYFSEGIFTIVPDFFATVALGILIYLSQK